MLKRSGSGWASKAVELYMDSIVYKATVLWGNLQPKFMLLLSMAFFFSYWKLVYKCVYNVIIHTVRGKKRMQMWWKQQQHEEGDAV